jgi:hypothetical protein
MHSDPSHRRVSALPRADNRQAGDQQTAHGLDEARSSAQSSPRGGGGEAQCVEHHSRVLGLDGGAKSSTAVDH